MKEFVSCSYCEKKLFRFKMNGKEKQKKNFFCNSKVCKALWQRKQREDLGYTKDWLYQEYIQKRRSINDIAREINRDPKRVYEWAKDYKIEIRSRGTNYGQCFKKGHVPSIYGKKHLERTKEKIRQKCLESGRVPYLKNGIHYLKGKRGEEVPNWKGGITPERQAFYSSEEWKNIVKKVWERDRAKCRRCGKHHNTKENRGSFHIHHIFGFEIKEVRAFLPNLVLLCKKCHYWVHGIENINKKFIKKKENDEVKRN